MEDCWNGNRLVSKTKAEVDSLDRVQLSDLPPNDTCNSIALTQLQVLINFVKVNTSREPYTAPMYAWLKLE